MTDSAQPFAAKKFLEIKGRRMAYIDEGEGAPIVFAHGNPTSSYLWRNVMPACRGLGRLIACDMIGMGDSEKLPDSGPDRYTYAEQRSFLFALWKKLGVDKDVVFVLHDWGSLLGFDWTRQNAERVQGIAYMEALVQPITWDDFPKGFLVVDSGGFISVNPAMFPQAFAQDIDPARAKVMAATQKPTSQSILAEKSGPPAWKQLPTWYQVSENDHIIPPAAERMFAKQINATTISLPSSHASPVSHPNEVAQIILNATKGSAR